MGKLVAEGIVAGVGLGGMYGLIAIGYTLIMAASGVFNFAQGSIVMGGILVLFWLWQLLGWPFLGVVVLVLAGGAVVGIVNYLLAVGPVAARLKATNLTEGTLVTTFGLGLVLNGIVARSFGTQIVPVNSYVHPHPFLVAGVPVRPVYIAMFAVMVVVVAAFELYLRQTRSGLLLRATVTDLEGARLAGIRVQRVVLLAFGIAGALAGVAGLMMAPVVYASPFAASDLALYGFLAMAIGGYGSFVGSLIGGLVVGIVSELVPIWLSPSFVNLILYAVLVLFLIVRPRGLFGVAGAYGTRKLREV